jgi:hypothetical protein
LEVGSIVGLDWFRKRESSPVVTPSWTGFVSYVGIAGFDPDASVKSEVAIERKQP